MAGKVGQGKIQQRILGELDARPFLSLQELNPDGNRSRRKALRRSATKLLQAGVLVRVRVTVPSSPVPIVHDVVAKVGTSIEGIQTTVRTDILEPVAEAVEEGEKLSLDKRIERLQEKINS